jgi:trigger factor
MKLGNDTEGKEKLPNMTETSELKSKKKPSQAGASSKVSKRTPKSTEKSSGNVKPKIDNKKEESLIVEFSVTVKRDDIEKNFEEALSRYASDIKLPGFRKGKVPLGVVKSRFKDAIIDEVKNKLVEEAVLTKIKNEKMRIITPPAVKKIDYEEGKDLEAEVKVEVFPEIKLPDLAGIEVEIPAKDLKIEPYNEEKALDLILQSRQRQEPVIGRSIKDKDFAQLKTQAKNLRTKRMTPKKSDACYLIKEEHHEILGLYDELIGKEKGAKLVFKRKYPADYKKKIWAGEEIEHYVEVENIFESVKPKLDEAFLKSMGFKEEKAFKDKLKDEYTETENKKREDKKIESIIKKLNELVDFPLPRSIVEQETSRIIQQNRYQLQSKNEKEFKDFFNSTKKSAEDSVRFSFIVEAIKTDYKLSVNNDDLEKEYKLAAEAHNVDIKEVRKHYMKSEHMEQLKETLIRRKVMNLLKEKIKIKEV